MNFGEKENFYERHRYFLQRYSFKFEGLKPSLQTKFDEIVTQLSGTVCPDAVYTLCDESYFNRLENQRRTDLFSINFILDSIVAKELLDIEKYRYNKPTKLQQLQSPCCLISKYVLRTNSCLGYYQDNVRCESCCVDNNNDHDDKNSKPCKNSKDKNQTVNVHQVELPNFDNEEINSTDEETEIIRRKRKAVITEALSPKKNKPSSSTVQIHSKNCGDEKNATKKGRCKRVVYIGNEWKTVELDAVEQENVANNIEASPAPVNTNSTEKINIANKIDTSPAIQKRKWWTCLPPPNKLKPVRETLYEKGGRRRGHDYSMDEKRQMIAYLILRDKIKDSNMREPWREMLTEGYLNDRSVESLHNHFRKSILPNIRKFGLPEDIVLKFL